MCYSHDTENKNIFLFGVPRSGTTWLSQILTYHNNVTMVHEPDNEMISFFGLLMKKKLSRFPYVRSNEENESLYFLFKKASTGACFQHQSLINKLFYKVYHIKKAKLQQNLKDFGTALPQDIPLEKYSIKCLIRRKKKTRVLVKTVHGILLIPFLLKKLNILPVVLFRNPLNVYSSYVTMHMPDKNRNIYINSELLNDYKIPIVEKSIEMENDDFKSGFQAGVFRKVLKKNVKDYRIIHADYETLISAPSERVKKLSQALFLPYTEEMDDYMKSRFRTGSGYETLREPKKQLEIWKKRLNHNQVDCFLAGYEKAMGYIDFSF